MRNRVKVAEATPGLYKRMMTLEQGLRDVELSPIEKELIKIRASQINGCAFCIDMHTQEALKQGEISKRIFLLNAWKETEVFTEKERVLLQMTEEITLIHQHGLSDETYQNALKFFTETQIAQIIMCIVTINAWNRIAIACSYSVQ